MYQYKQLIGPRLNLRDHNTQAGESLAGVKAISKVTKLGICA